VSRPRFEAANSRIQAQRVIAWGSFHSVLCLNAYTLNLWTRALSENPLPVQLVENFRTRYGTRKSLPSPNAQATRPYPERANPVNTLAPHSFTIPFNIILLNRDSVVGAATAYGLDDRGVVDRVPVVSRILFSTSSRPALGSTQPPTQWVPEALFPAVKRPRREADNSSPASAEVKKMWIYTSTPSYAFMA
jgi:hypothetical protein